MKIIYIMMFLSLWSLGLLVLFHRTRSNFWIGLTILLGGSASFAFAMHLSIMPVIGGDWMPDSISYLLYWLTVTAMHIYFYVLPYVFFMGGLWLNDWITVWRKMLFSALLLPVPIILLSDHLLTRPWNYFDLDWFRWWAGGYIALGCFFYCMAYFREKNEGRRRSQWRTLIFPTAMTYAYVTDYLGFDTLKLGWWSFDLVSNEMWQTNFIVILGTVGTVLFYIIRYGFLGFKLRIERERIDYSIRTLTMGVSILNHSIKNEIQKIDYLAEKSRKQISAGQSVKAARTIEQVHQLTSHLQLMVNRIKEKAEDIVLDESQHDVAQLIYAVIASMEVLVEHRKVTLSASIEAKGHLNCDMVHVKETLSNLIRNSMDALPGGGGRIELRTIATRREFRIEVKDDGAGIPQEYVSKIFEPFFTTKKNTLNYGLGLSYCSSVMSKHGGKMSVAESEPGAGTVMVLHFPKSRFKPLPLRLSIPVDRNLDQLNPS